MDCSSVPSMSNSTYSTFPLKFKASDISILTSCSVEETMDSELDANRSFTISESRPLSPLGHSSIERPSSFIVHRQHLFALTNELTVFNSTMLLPRSRGQDTRNLGTGRLLRSFAFRRKRCILFAVLVGVLFVLFTLKGPGAVRKG